jgi:hypothetical protein
MIVYVFLHMIFTFNIIYSSVKSNTAQMNFSLPDHFIEAQLNGKGLSIGEATTQQGLNVQGMACIDEGVSSGTSDYSSNQLSFNGTLSLGGIKTISSSQAFPEQTSLVLVSSSSGNVTIDLPNADTATGKVITLKRIDKQNRVMLTSPECQVNGQRILELVNPDRGGYADVSLVSNGHHWFCLTETGLGTCASANLTAWWPLEAPSSSSVIEDLSAYQQDGALTDTNNSGLNSSGVYDGALDFDGTDDVVEISSLSANTFAEQGSLSMWFNTDDTISADGVLLDIETTVSGNFFRCSWDESGAGLNFTVQSPGAVDFNSSTLSEGEWHHMLVVWEEQSTSFKVIINGTEIHDDSTSGAVFSNNTVNEITLGQSRDLDQPYRGQLDDLRIYNKVLDQGERDTLLSIEGS